MQTDDARSTDGTAGIASPVTARGRLKDRHIAMIALGGTIGAGLFVGSSAAIASAGPGILMVYAGTGLLVVLVMRMLGEMLLRRPVRGTFVDCIRFSLGPGAAFLAGWLYWLFWVVTIGTEAIAGAIILGDLIPLPVWILAPALILLVNLINLAPVDFFGESEFWLSTLKVSAIVAFVVIGFFVLAGFGCAVSPVRNFLGHGGFLPRGLGAVIAAVPSVLFSMIGTEAATVAAAESENARENLARVTRSIGLRLVMFYFLSAVLLLSLVPWTSIVPGTSPFITVMQAIGIPGATVTLKIVVFSAIFSCLNSSIYITSRTLCGLAENGEAPSAFAGLNARALPERAVLFCSMIGLLVAFSSIISAGHVFAFFLSATGALILIVYGLIVLAHLGAYREDPGNRAFTLPFRGRLDYAVLIGIALVLLAMLFQPDQRGTVLASLFSTAVVAVIHVVRRRFSSHGADRRTSRAG